MGASFGVPYLQHTGWNESFPSVCNCSTPEGLMSVCDKLSLLTGLIFYNTDNNLTYLNTFPAETRYLVPIIEFFYRPPVNTAKSANTFAYFPSWVSIKGYNSSQQLFTDETFRKSMYEFTVTNSFGSGFMVNFLTKSVYGDQSITQQKFQLKDGACNDAIYSPDFYRLTENVWGTLVQDYYSCTYKKGGAFVTAVGLAASTADAIIGLAVVLLTGTILCVREYRHSKTETIQKWEDDKVESAPRSTDEKLNSLIDILDSFVCVWGFQKPFGSRLKGH